MAKIHTIRDYSADNHSTNKNSDIPIILKYILFALVTVLFILLIIMMLFQILPINNTHPHVESTTASNLNNQSTFYYTILAFVLIVITATTSIFICMFNCCKGGQVKESHANRQRNIQYVYAYSYDN